MRREQNSDDGYNKESADGNGDPPLVLLRDPSDAKRGDQDAACKDCQHNAHRNPRLIGLAWQADQPKEADDEGDDHQEKGESADPRLTVVIAGLSSSCWHQTILRGMRGPTVAVYRLFADWLGDFGSTVA